MKKFKIISLICIYLIFILSSCANKADENSTIQLWWYDDMTSGLYSKAVENIIDRVKLYCDSSGIPLEVVKHNRNTLGYDDYILKRNVAMAKGNMILIEDMCKLHDISKQHADYSKIERYSTLLDIYKDRFCIPLGVGHRTVGMRNDIFKYYDINTDKSIITKDEYFDIKQQMKEKGAKFTPNIYEYAEIIEYYLKQNGLKYISDYSEILNTPDELKKAIKKTANDVFNDIKSYSSDYKGFDFTNSEEINKSEYVIYDENSKLGFNFSEYLYMLTYYEAYSLLNDDILDMTFVYNKYHANSPCIFIYKKVTNEKIYNIANEMLDISYYKLVSDHMEHSYSPVSDTDEVREFLEVNKNWEYTGPILKMAESGLEKSEKTVNLINDIYEIFIKDDQISKQIADSLFSNPEYYSKIYNQVNLLVQVLISEKVDTEELEKVFDESIDDFITNFKVYYD